VPLFPEFSRSRQLIVALLQQGLSMAKADTYTQAAPNEQCEDERNRQARKLLEDVCIHTY
jgi:hypothetical protein